MTYYHEKSSVGIWRAAKTKPVLSPENSMYDSSYVQQISNNLVTWDLDSSIMGGTKSLFQTFNQLKNNFLKLVIEYN